MEGNGKEQTPLKFSQHTHQPPIHLRICQHQMDEHDRRDAREKTRGLTHTHAQDHRVSMPRIQHSTQLFHRTQGPTKF